MDTTHDHGLTYSRSVPYAKKTPQFLREVISPKTGPLAASGGRLITINGRCFYSPNCSRDVGMPPMPHGSGHHRVRRMYYDGATVTDDMGMKRDPWSDSVFEFHQPLWWTRNHCYLAFLQTAPISTGVLEHIFDTPVWYSRYGAGFALDPAIVLRWNRLEFDMRRATTLLSDRIGMQDMPQLIDTAVACTGFYSTVRQLRGDVTRSKEWFSYWLCRLSYVMASSLSTSNDAVFRMEINAETGRIEVADWYRYLTDQHFGQSYLASMHSAAGVFDPSVARAGVFLDILQPENGQFTVDWFLRFNVPVWYPWGADEVSAASTRADIARLAPPDGVTATIAPSSSFDMRLATRHRVADEGVSYPSWSEYFEQRRIRNAKIRLMMSDAQLRSLDNKQKNPPVRRGVSVYIWFRLSNHYQRVPLCRISFEDAFSEYGVNQKTYDAVENAWDLCHEFGSSTLDEQMESEDEYDSDSTFGCDSSSDFYDPRAGGRLSDSSSRDLPALRNCADRYTANRVAHPVTLVRYHALAPAGDITEGIVALNDYYGFVPPDPIPKPTDSDVLTVSQQKKYSAFVGHSTPDTGLFNAVGHHIAQFFESLASDSETPPGDLWDLAQGNRMFLSSPRLRAIRSLSKSVYIFDFGHMAKVKWNIAVSRASIAMFICRLDYALSDYEVAFCLLQRGIPFSTLVTTSHMITCSPPSRPLPVFMYQRPLNVDDYITYTIERDALLSDTRVGRAALLQGGIVWRLVGQSCQFATALLGPSSAIKYQQLGAVNRTSRTDHYACDDVISTRELDLICGTVICMTGNGDEYVLKSWWPRKSIWTECIPPYWSPVREEWFLRREKELKAGRALPLSASEWRKKLRGCSFERRVLKRVEDVSSVFARANCGEASGRGSTDVSYSSHKA